MAAHARAPVAHTCARAHRHMGTQAQKRETEEEEVREGKLSIIRGTAWLGLPPPGLTSGPYKSSFLSGADASFEELVRLVYNEASILNRTWHSRECWEAEARQGINHG